MRLDKRFLKYILLPGTLLAVLTYIYIGYFCSEETCGSRSKLSEHRHSNFAHFGNPSDSSIADKNRRIFAEFPSAISNSDLENDKIAETSGESKDFEIPETFSRDDVDKRIKFSTQGDQVMVFLHIQKTGGTTFGRHLVKNIVGAACVNLPNRREYDCNNSKGNIWLFSRFSTGWACGLHADWTVLQNCVEETVEQLEKKVRKRRFHYISMLREPALRYLSEWRHVKRGATWGAAKLLCDGREATLEELPVCYESADWTGVSLKEFYSCDSNLANNRQVRMLANISKVGCYNRTKMSELKRNRILLDSAITNLRNLAYFGLTEYQRESQFLFEKTFGLKFSPDFLQYNRTKGDREYEGLADEDLGAVDNVNALDINLYKYAKKLFFQRLKYAQDLDNK